jgi:methyl-accepting chemotaxis protein
VQYVGAALILCLVVGLVIGVILRSILRQLGGEPAYAAQIASRIADGDLDVVVETKAGDTVSLLAAMQRMQHRLAQAITQIRSGATLISTVSNEIAAGNADLSRRTEQQATALGETASSMEQITATVKQNADNAKQASQLAHNASETAARGGEVVGQVVETMRGISQSSHRIGDIIGVIEGIAFQTNILALNAAVEAARAGEEGRGFAVVAGEVRSLAQRSAAAAKEIKTLIEESAAQIEGGSQYVGRAGETMQEVVHAVRRVTDIMGEISAASVEQSSGIEQVNIAVASMDQTTQQNAALVEEASASADVLKAQTGQLAAAIAVFTLPEGA